MGESGSGNEVDATVGGQRTPSVSPPQDAEMKEPEAEADSHGSDKFVSAESEVVSTPTRQMPDHAARITTYH
eukprot:878809-Amphidinium_carterae.4